MAVAGLTRLRKHQFGRQSVFGTPVAAKRAYPFSGVPSNELNWTDPEVDAGSFDPVTAPYRGAMDLTASLTAPVLNYDDNTLIQCGFFGGGDTPAGAGAAKTWTTAPSSTTADPFDLFTYEFGDDVTTDWFQLSDGILESFEITGPEGLGPLSATMGWRFADLGSSGSTDMPDSPVVPTAALSVDTSPNTIFLKDGALAIATVYGDLGTSQITDALHTFTLRGTQEVDQKRWANGDQSYAIDEYGRGARTLELECTFSKTADTVGIGSESDAWMSNEAINRWARLTFTSTETISTGPDVFYSWTVDFPMRYYTRTEGEIGGNTVIVLTGHAYYEPVSVVGPYKSVLVNSLANANF